MLDKLGNGVLFDDFTKNQATWSIWTRYFVQAKMNTRSTNDSNFLCEHFSNSYLEFFDNFPVLEPIESSQVQEVYFSNLLDESSIEFEVETNRSIYLDMRDIHLRIEFGLKKGRLFDKFTKKDENGKRDTEMSFTDDDLHYLTHVNNLLHSLFSNCEVYLNNPQVYNSMVSMNTRLYFQLNITLPKK